MEPALELIIPDTYPNLIGTILIIVSVLCLFISFFEAHQRHATKLCSILIVTSLALFSSHGATYFAAIFIVATAVTELEFLQTLAAIIRKDKNYFDYKKESLSSEDNISRKAKEALEEELLTTSDEVGSTKSKIDLSTLLELSRPDTMRLSLDIEDKSIIFLENKYGKIERNVRFRKSSDLAEFDGVIETKGKNSKIFEIKWIRNPDFFYPFTSNSIRRTKDLVEKYRNITGVNAEIHLVVIINTKTSVSSSRIEKVHEKAREAGVILTLLSLSEVGFEVSHKID